MARKESTTLTDAELRLMQIVWELGTATVQDVVDALPVDAPLAYSTVLTMLRILEKKGYLKHRKKGRAFVYQPVVGKHEARQGALRHLMQRFFENSPRLLLLNLIENESIDPEELEQLKKLIDSSDENATNSSNVENNES